MFSFFKKLFGKSREEADPFGYLPADKLPDEFPGWSFEVELSRGGGKAGGSAVTNIYGSGSVRYREHVSMDMEQYHGCQFSLLPGEAEEIFNKFKEYRFDEIEMVEESMLDVPSTTLTVRWEGHYMVYSVSQISRVKDNSPGSFYACVGLVESTVRKHSERHRYPVKLVPDEALLQKGSGFSACVDMGQSFPDSPYYESESGSSPETLMLMPGVYLFKLRVETPESSFGNKKYKFNEYVYVTVMKDQSSTIQVSMSDFRLEWKVIMQRV